MTEPTPEQMRFNELLPFYINGTVGEADRQWMEDYATNNPEATVWLRFDENIRASIQSTAPPILRKLEGSLTDGPTETGELWITLPRGRSIDEAYAMLKSSILVDDALITIGANAKCP
jgi:hypothetical protein